MTHNNARGLYLRVSEVWNWTLKFTFLQYLSASDSHKTTGINLTRTPFNCLFIRRTWVSWHQKGF